MKLTAKDLYDLKVIDKIIKEPQTENEEENFQKTAASLKKEIKTTILQMKDKTENEIVEERYKKFRNMGEFIKI